MGRWALAAVVVAAVLAACGGDGSDGNPSKATQAGSNDAAGSCERDDDELLDRYATFLSPASGIEDFLDVLQSGDDDFVRGYVQDYVAGTLLYAEFRKAFLGGGEGAADPTFRVDDVDYVDERSAVIVLTVSQELVDLGPASVQLDGRFVCTGGDWDVALDDLCELMLDAVTPCDPFVVDLAARGLPPALVNRDPPDLVEPTVPTTAPPATSPPDTTPKSPDGFCPFLGGPCSAEVLADPDCACQPLPNLPAAAGIRPRFLTGTVCTRR